MGDRKAVPAEPVELREQALEAEDRATKLFTEALRLTRYAERMRISAELEEKARAEQTAGRTAKVCVRCRKTILEDEESWRAHYSPSTGKTRFMHYDTEIACATPRRSSKARRK